MSLLQIETDDISKLVADVCGGFLGLEVDATLHRDPAGFDWDVSAFVHISGDWTGAVILKLESELATAMATAMFGMGPEEGLSDAEINDAVGEVANMIGGAVKNRVQGACSLSPPGVLAGTNATVRVRGASPRLICMHDCAGRPLRVDVFERAAN